MRSLLTIITLSIGLTSLIAHAVLPPLNEEARTDLASDVVTGYVTSVEKRVVDRDGGFSDAVYQVKMIVTDVVKGNVKPGQVVTLKYRRLLSAPDGWCGPAGQYGVIKNYSSIRAYMLRDESGDYFLLEPNGFSDEK